MLKTMTQFWRFESNNEKDILLILIKKKEYRTKSQNKLILSTKIPLTIVSLNFSLNSFSTQTMTYSVTCPILSRLKQNESRICEISISVFINKRLGSVFVETPILHLFSHRNTEHSFFQKNKKCLVEKN